MMDPEKKKAWVDALRSGEYVQGRGVLCKADTGAMCCLGVAADVLLDTNWHLMKDPDDDRVDVYGLRASIGQTTWENSTVELSNEYLEEIGITPDEQIHLVQLNDGGISYKDGKISTTRPRSFDQIAKWIEKNL